jgi:hypothetical protein
METNWLQCEETLKPEHRRALMFINTHVRSLENDIINGPITDSIFHQGSYLVSGALLSSRMIPSGNHWKWNQTKSRKHALLTEHQAHVRLFKLIPRRKSSGGSHPRQIIPSIKLWKYEISFLQQPERCFHALWCERGLPKPEAPASSPPATTSPPSTPAQPSDESTPLLEDFSFLAWTMEDRALAQQLWPGCFSRLAMLNN